MSVLSLAKLEARIESIQERVAEIDRQLADPRVYADGQRCRALQSERSALERQLAPLEEEWSRRAE